MGAVFLLSALWAACGVVGWAITLGYFEGEYGSSCWGDGVFVLAAFVALCGPGGLMVAVIKSRFVRWGLLWWPR